MDDDSLNSLIEDYGKVHGLIFLFKWQAEGEKSSAVDNNAEKGGEIGAKIISPEEIPEDLFFAKQVTTNACATQAILSILLNADKINECSDEYMTSLRLGDSLSSLKSFTSSFPANLKGEAIGASEDIRTAHNSFARKEVLLMDNSKKRINLSDSETFHFVAYVPHQNGMVYELDGLQQGPIEIGAYKSVKNDSLSTKISDFSWLSTACRAIQSRIKNYSTSEIKFNLMALTSDKRIVIQQKIQNLRNNGTVDDDPSIQSLQMELLQEDDQRQRWKEENERRRHNFLPLVMELLRGLAKVGVLQECVSKANRKVEA